jgi:hypothetical protein
MSTIVLSEQQRRMLLFESVTNDIENVKKHSEKLSEKIYNEIKQQYSFDFKILLTWSSSIGGFLTPLSQLINGEIPEVSTTDSYLILAGVVFTVLFQNESNFKKIKNILKEKGLYETFLVVKEKALNLKSSLFKLLSSLNITVNTISGIIAYSFLIPVIPILMQFATSHTISDEDILELAKRVSAWGLTILSSNTLKNIFTKLINKLN